MVDSNDNEGGSGRSASGLSRYLLIIVEHIWVVLIVFGGVLAAGLWWMSEQPERFRASAQIVIETEQPQLLGEVDPVVDPVGTGYWANREFIQTQIRLITSRNIAETVAQELQLETDLEFLGVSRIVDPVEQQVAIQAIDIPALIQSVISVTPIQDSQLVNITAVTGSAASAAAIANATARVYSERNLQRNVESIERAATWLEEQQQILQNRLEESEQALVLYRRNNNILTVTLKDNVSLLASMQNVAGQLADARLETERLRSIVREIDSALESGNLSDLSVEAVLDNVLVQGLKQQLIDLQVSYIELSTYYLDEHPEVMAVSEQLELVQRSLENEVRTILEVWQNRFRNAESLERSLAARLAMVEAEVQQLGEHEVNYNRLLLDAEGNRELFLMIKRRMQEVDLTRNSQYNNVEVVEAAVVPRRPYNPQQLTQLGAIVLLALALAFATALGLDSLDTTVRSTEDLEREFALSFLGLVPSIRPKRSRRRSARGPARGQSWNPDTYVYDFPRSSLSEACRTIRTNLHFLGTEKPLNRILVTSAGPREGKTTMTSNIGTVMAQSGQRVLIIDTDLRRPRLHKAWGMSADVGLTSVLTGEATFEEAIQSTPVENLFVLASGPIPPNPTELMHTERFQEVLNELSSRFYQLILDSPPVTPVTDAALLSRFVDGIVLIIKAGVTRKEILHRTLDQLRSVRANILGCVLNDVDLSRRSYGYYAQGYYYRRAQEYYGEDLEEKSAGS